MFVEFKLIMYIQFEAIYFLACLTADDYSIYWF